MTADGDGEATHGRPLGNRRVPREALEWAALSALLIGVAGYVGFDLRSSHRSIEAFERTRLEHQAQVVEKMLGTRLQATVNALDALRADAPALMGQPAGIRTLSMRMRVMASSMAGVRTFVLVNADGTLVASDRPELIGTDVREGERYRAIRSHPDASAVYISPPFLTPLGAWVLSIGRAIVARPGEFGGYLLAIIDPDYWNLLLDATRYAPDMSTAMIHGGGKVIFEVPAAMGAVGTNLAREPNSTFEEHIRSGKSLTSWPRALGFSGDEELAVFQTILPSTGAANGFLVASFRRRASAIFAPWREELRDRIVLVAAAALMAASALYVRQRRRAAAAHRQAERDVARRRQEEARTALQAQLAQSQKLESIGRLAGGVAHDFNNLLTVILSLGEDAREDVRRGSPPRPEDLDEIVEAGQRAADLTRQLLAFARKQVIAPVALDINEQVRNSKKLLRRLIGENIHIEERLQDGLWTVRCDPGLLGQVILNLSVNARDAMPEGGTLTLATQNVTLASGEPLPDSTMSPGEYVRLRVEDSGTGMTPEVQAHLFEPFFTTKGQGKGTGLGLATVYGIVKQTGAYMRVRSTVGKGTVFEILFARLCHDDPPTVNDGPGKDREGGSETILVVEDDPGVRGAVVRTLRSGGYTVVVASSADEVRSLACERDCLDLLLTDVVMPGLGGAEVARLVVEKCPRVKVLYMSGYTDDAIGRQGVLDEGVEFLPKPFTPALLLARVRAVLDRVGGGRASA